MVAIRVEMRSNTPTEAGINIATITQSRCSNIIQGHIITTVSVNLVDKTPQPREEAEVVVTETLHHLILANEDTFHQGDRLRSISGGAVTVTSQNQGSSSTAEREMQVISSGVRI